MQLAELKTQALRYVVLGDLGRAFKLYQCIVTSLPDDLDARMKVADVLVTAGLPDLARRGYAAVGLLGPQGRRPPPARRPAPALADPAPGPAPPRHALVRLIHH